MKWRIKILLWRLFGAASPYECYWSRRALRAEAALRLMRLPVPSDWD